MRSRTDVFQLLEFRADFIQPEDKTWGLDAGNLNWTGMVGMLQRYLRTIESELLNLSPQYFLTDMRQMYARVR